MPKVGIGELGCLGLGLGGRAVGPSVGLRRECLRFLLAIEVELGLGLRFGLLNVGLGLVIESGLGLRLGLVLRLVLGLTSVAPDLGGKACAKGA